MQFSAYVCVGASEKIYTVKYFFLHQNTEQKQRNDFNIFQKVQNQKKLPRQFIKITA